MSFTTFKNKPVSSGVILLEFASSIAHNFFINEEPGIWYYKWRVEADTTYNYENGAFCYGCFENECLGYKTNNNPVINVISFTVDGTAYSQTTSLANLRSTNRSFWWDGETVHVHFDNFDPPWVFTTITIGASVAVTNKGGSYNGIFFDPRLTALTPLTAKADPMFYGLLGYNGTKATLINNDGAFDDITVFDLYGQEVEIRYGEEGDTYANFELMFNGIIEQFKLSATSLILDIKDRRKRFKRSVPTAYFDAATYPYINEDNEDTPIPLLYGSCDNVPVVCTNEDESSPASYAFKICDTTYHPIKAIDAVRVEGVAKTPASTNLTNATFTLSTGDYSPGDEVTADVRGYTKTGINLMYNPACEKTGTPHLKGQTPGTYHATWARSNDRCYSGLYSFKLVKSDPSGTAATWQIHSPLGTSNMLGLTAGKSYTFRAWVYNPTAGGIPNGDFNCSIQYYDGSWHTSSDQASAGLDVWQQIEVTLAIPVGATGAQARFNVGSASAAGAGSYLYIDNIEFFSNDDPWLIENPLDIIEDVLNNHADVSYTSDNYDQTAWAAAKILAPESVQFFTNALITLEMIVQRVCVSLNGVMYAKSDGKFTFRYFHAAKSISETVLKDERFGQFDVEYPSEFFISSVSLSYDKDYNESKSIKYVNASQESTLGATYHIIKRYEADTLLNLKEDVQTLASNLLTLYAKIPRWTSIRTRTAHMSLELLDDLTVNLDRDERTWLGDVDLRIYGVKKDLMSGFVELELREAGMTLSCQVVKVLELKKTLTHVLLPYWKPLRGQQLNRTHPLTRGLVAYWGFQEGSGESVYDLSGYGTHGKTVGSLDWRGSPRGYAAYIALNNQVEMSGESAALRLLNGGTVCTWAKPDADSPDHGRIVDNYYGGVYGWTIGTVGVPPVSIYVSVGNIGGVAASVLTPGEWSFLVFTFNGTGRDLYVNGRNVRHFDSTTLPIAASPIVTIGNWVNGARPYKGEVESVFIYDRVLSVEEIHWLHREPYALFEPWKKIQQSLE